ncbi:S8 family serine peptidase [Paracoccus benzoatiresistens]|uniref:S8 family serine peptidase n=1 Tax=Paracoccus benzoatiresistens TaxID=2997341 RepID=A0ABT4J787_9RHOB|nr:S8 family serine peptidase [Paracoccus sp. EF6]MCZ0962510.1 S8 family serine peptidase [Paracoccus sp. EF6]
MPRLILFLAIIALTLAGHSRPEGDGWSLVAAAHADDDDDDDDDRVVRRARPVPAAPETLATRAENEILARGVGDDAVATMRAQGFRVLQRRDLDGGSLVRMLKPASLTMDEARDRARALAAGADADFNHFYRSEQAGQGVRCDGPDCLARDMIGWPASLSGCGAMPRIGMVDTGLNADHAALSEARIRVHRIDTGAPPSDLLHGTAVASLLVGDADSRSPGLIPGAELVAVDAFQKVAADQRADAFALIEALDYLAAQDVRIVNLSLAGPPNAALGRQVARMAEDGVLLIAAAGNHGPRAAPAFPAAYDAVLAVTAVDRRGQVYRRANRGNHIDLAAPGVNVWTAASVSGARAKTGTSYAAPFVTAAAALLWSRDPSLSAAQMRKRLRGEARDLGPNGQDAIFGAGLIAPPPGC